MGNKPIKSVLIAAAAAASLFITGCSDEKKAAAPPRLGSPAHSWLTANDAYKAGDYVKVMQTLSRLTTQQNEYRDRARVMLLAISGGVANGYLQLSNAYEEGAKISKTAGADYRQQVRDLRNTANAAALQFAETIHEIMDTQKDAKYAFEFGFPAGETTEPAQMAKIRKGLPLQGADHELARKSMAQMGVVKFAAMAAGAPTDLAKAKTQFAGATRDQVLAAIASNLISASDLYSSKKMDIPKRGNALCKEAEEAIALMADSKEKKALDAKAKDGLKKFKVAS
jgi:hypothetical protein